MTPVEPLPEAWPEGCTRFVFVAPRLPEMSGGSTATENLSDALAARGITVEHLSLWPGTRPARFPTLVLRGHERLHAGPVLRSGRGWLSQLAALPRWVYKVGDRWLGNVAVRRYLDRLGPESVLVFTHVQARIALARIGWKPSPGGPIIVGQHHSQFESLVHEPWTAAAIPEWFSGCDVFTTLSEEDAAKFATVLPCRCVAIPNPMASTRATESSFAPIAVALARLSGEKQLDLMIRAFAAATRAPDLRHWALHIYGEGPERASLSAAIESSGAADRIHLRGQMLDVGTPLSQASINLLSSSYEGFGMSILEAAAAGVPSMSFDCSPGVRSLINETTGVLVPAGDESAYANELAGLLRAPQRLRKLGAGARSRSQEFSAGAIVKRWAEVVQLSGHQG